MLKHIRVASQDEVEALRATSNYPPEFLVWAMDQNEGQPDFAVAKHIVEVDPVKFGSRTNDVQKAKFLWAVEERLAGAGVPMYYFSVDAADERWQKVIESWGAQRTAPFSEIRYQKELK